MAFLKEKVDEKLRLVTRRLNASHINMPISKMTRRQLGIVVPYLISSRAIYDIFR